MTVAFLALLRAAGVLSVPDGTVTWVSGLHESRVPPRPDEPVSGALLLIAARKASQATPSWVPIRAGIATTLLATHVCWRDSKARANPFLFPSRCIRKLARHETTWAPHNKNRLSQASLLTLIRSCV